MKKKAKLLVVILSVLMLIPFISVNAATKTDTIVENLKEMAASFDGTVDYEYGTIDIKWNIPNSKYTEISYSYNGNVIEYNPGELSTFEEAEDASGHYMYILYLIQASLRVNGFSDKEIKDFFANENNNFDYEKCGIEFKKIGEDKKYTSADGTTTITVSPMSIKIDVTKANINGDSAFVKKTTIEDVIENLQADKDFTVIEYDGKIAYQNDIYSDDDTITIGHTYYWEDYHNVSFSVEDDIITYEDADFESYDDAESAGSHHMFMSQIIMYALKANGYTTEEIQKYFADESNSFDFDINGIEIKEIGESKKYTSEDGTSSVTVTPMSFKVDLKRSNLNESSNIYEILDGAKQKIDNRDELTFRFNIDYAKFKESGRIYINDELVYPDFYTVKEGSTIITFDKDFVKDLSEEEHTLKVLVDDGIANTTFTIANVIKNPQTADNVVFYMAFLGISVIGLIGVGIYTKKRLLN